MVAKFHTEFRNVMKFIKYSGDKNAPWKMVNSDARFKSLSRETANVINTADCTVYAAAALIKKAPVL